MDIEQFKISNVAQNLLTSSNVDKVLSSFDPLFVFTPLVLIFGILALRRLLSIRCQLNQKYVFLELTPPSTVEKTAYTTQQLFMVIHDLGERRNLFERLLGLKRVYSFEIISTKEKGIRYVLRLRAEDADTIKKSILSYLAQVRIKTISEYLPEDINTPIVEYKLKKHFAYPLKAQDTLKEHDPVAYITGMMTKLNRGELISFQVVLSPSNKREAGIIMKKILRGENVLSYLNKIIRVPNLPFMQTSAISVKVPISPAHEKITTLIEKKVSQPLFEAKIRLLVDVSDKKSYRERTSGFLSSLAVFSTPGFQSIQKKKTVSIKLINKLNFFSFKKRLLSLISNSSPYLLSISEISDLYHFPYTKTTQTENIAKTHSKELPAPFSLKQSNILDITFAKNTYGGQTTMIGLTREERARHMYVIGATGTGKSTLLLSMINQDLHSGNGVCIVDPHGDLAEVAVNCIPAKRTKDLIYFNPFDIKYPIGINLLELTPDLDEDDALLEKEFICESVISLFRKVFSDAWSAHPHRIEYILRNTIHTAFTLENSTLFTIFDLLNNPTFQKNAIKGLQDENLKNFWKYEFGKAGDYQKVKMVAPVTARIGRFLFSPSARRILEQEKSTINFDAILDSKKILICNLAKGNIGEDTSEVMGIMILNKIQLAALKRARVEKQKRNEFYLYVDEFQNFATPSFVQMLSEARKYGLNLIMAEQSTSQQKDRNIVDIILANAGTIVSFRSANPRDEQMLLPQFSPYVAQNEISNLPSFHFYMKKAAILPEEPFSGITMPVTVKKDSKKWTMLIDTSRKNNAIKYKTKDKQIVVKKNTTHTTKTLTSSSSGILPA